MSANTVFKYPTNTSTVGTSFTSAVTIPERLSNAVSCPSSAISSPQMLVKPGRGLVESESFPIDGQ